MKTTIVKMLMPVAAFVLASAGAVSTNASHSLKSSTALVPGYIHSAMPCQPSIQCSLSGGFVCQTNITSGPQVFGKDAAGPGCAVTLYRP
jgi:hypothetical protein